MAREHARPSWNHQHNGNWRKRDSKKEGMQDGWAAAPWASTVLQALCYRVFLHTSPTQPLQVLQMRNLTMERFSDLAWVIDKVQFNTRFLGSLKVGL